MTYAPLVIRYFTDGLTNVKSISFSFEKFRQTIQEHRFEKRTFLLIASPHHASAEGMLFTIQFSAKLLQIDPF